MSDCTELKNNPFRHKVKECFVYEIASSGWKLTRILPNTVLIVGYN